MTKINPYKICLYILIVAAVALFGFLPATAQVALRFDGGVGVIPVSSGIGEGLTSEVLNRNIVRGVQPAGQPWVISELVAEVDADGMIAVVGRGLLLAGGSNIGSNAGASVFATLICETTAPFVERSTTMTGVPLEANGDFMIEDMLMPWPPAECSRPALLIRNASNMGWFAAGIQDYSGVTIIAMLSGMQEVPPVATPGSGTATLDVNLATGAMSGTVTFTGLTSNATAAHIHQAAAGVNGPIIIPLVGGAGATAGTWMVPAGTVMTPAQLTALQANQLYINVHTLTNPGGELRGQIIFSAP
jgi:hypothetical protein